MTRLEVYGELALRELDIRQAQADALPNLKLGDTVGHPSFPYSCELTDIRDETAIVYFPGNTEDPQARSMKLPTGELFHVNGPNSPRKAAHDRFLRRSY